MIARTRLEAPQLPKHLRAATKLWFSDVCEQYELEAHHVLLLTIARDAYRDTGSKGRDAGLTE
jgi:hypothetical protein